MKVIRYEWEIFARENQLCPAGDWYIWLIMAGRGYGKTRTGAEMTRIAAHTMPGCHIALVAETAADARDVMVEGPDSGLLAISPPWFYPKYEPSKRRLTWPNGSYATTYSGDEPDQLRGPQHHFAWPDELAKWKYPQDAWDNLEFGLRLGKRPRAVVTTTPRPIPIIKQMVQDEQVHVTTGSTYENMHNLAATFIHRVVKKYEGTRLGRQELHAHLLDDNPNALWNRATIEKLRVTKAPPLQRVAGGVDPTATSTGDEAGIIYAGVAPCSCKGHEELHAFVIDDRSTAGSPSTWATAVVTGYHLHRADRVIGETNNGGEMVELTIRTVPNAKNVSYKGIHASRGKYTRAEPVAALYEQGKVHHVGMFALLEDEMCSWVPGEDSPNRMDGLVWVLTYLMLTEESTSVQDETDAYSYVSY
jgi:phage terminase large subunit-like protein